ncbi:MAG TPA: DAK2 domain-containing protein [Candidatus Butyricicoccus stercorigallinarum]|nr:DAK2 domain-containing protein [Candidatus Butyricicoccus stercorigallinarum]
MVIEGALSIEEKKEEANELNVFPVPDGDTGTNMSLTMASARDEVSRLSNPDLPAASAATASALLRGARGNSGVILSLLFRGISKQLKTCKQASGQDLALALHEGVQAAYKAVMKPAEGTILTVSRVTAQHVLELCQSNPDIDCGEVLRSAIDRGREALADTTHQNPVLEKAGVVDAGGFGFLTILEGMYDAYNGVHRERTAAAEAAPAKTGATFSDIREEDITFTYCTEFIAERRDKSRNVQRLRAFLDGIGDSLVVVDDDDIIKVHVHTDRPNEALEAGLKFGQLLTVKIENMRQQHSAKIVEEAAGLESRERKIAEPEKRYGFVSVAAGDGLVNVFRDLGADEMVQGGQTMNPSTDDILHAIDAVPAEVVFVLPNNKNIIMAAEQAVPLCESKTVVIIPTKNIPQGISAMLSFDEEAALDENREAMLDAAANVRAGQVTYAARNSDFDGKKIREGEYLSLFESKLCANSRKLDDAVKKLVREMTRKECSFINIIYGADMTEEDAARVEKMAHKEAPDAEITVIDGGQPVYYFILSAES